MAVVIKGKSISGSQSSRDHYLRGPENERITVREVKGFATQDPDEALRMIELSAKGSKCKRPVYSVKINPATDRVWTKKEIERAVDLLEENLGLTGHQRVVVEHLKNGRIHYHVLWSRFPPNGGAAVRMSNDYTIHQKTQRQLEKEFKLRPMMAQGRDLKDGEVKWAKRYGFDIFKLRQQITTDFNKSRSGQEFKAKLEAQGIILCRGDKSQFVLILPWGQHKALSSMIHGRPTKALLRRAMSDIDIATLPTIAEGKAIVKATLPKVKRKRGGKYTNSSPGQTALWPTAGKSSLSHAAWKASRDSVTAQLPQPVTPIIITAASVATSEDRRSEQPAQSAPPTRKRTDSQNIAPHADDPGDDAMPPSRADAAYQDEFDKWTGLIEAAAKDMNVPKDQRKANAAILRQRQHSAANAARKRVHDEEKSIARANRRAKRFLLKFLEPPSQR